MGSYELFAWRDALSVAQWLDEDFDVSAVRRHFIRLPVNYLVKFEDRNSAVIEELIRRTESQRPSYLRKVSKTCSDLDRGLLIVFVIICLVRVKDILELRDRYRYELAPGSGNRVTCAGAYAFQQEVVQASGYEWPGEVFSAIEIDDGEFDEEREEDLEELNVEEPPTFAEPPEPRPATQGEGGKQRLVFASRLGQLDAWAIDHEHRLVRSKNGSSESAPWSFVLSNGKDGGASMIISPTKPAPETLADAFRSIRIKHDHSRVEVVLGLQSSLKGIQQALAQQKASEHLKVEVIKPPVALSRLVDEYLADLDAELALIGEKPFTIAELLVMFESTLWLIGEEVARSNEAVTYVVRRAEMHRLIARLLAHRGRAIEPSPDIPSTLRETMFGPSEDGAFESQMRKLERYVEEGTATQLGHDLYQCGKLVQRWRDDPRAMSVDKDADALAEFLIRRRQSRGGIHGNVPVHDLLGQGTLEADFAEASVMRRLQHPLPAAWFVGAGSWPSAASNKLLSTFWCEVELTATSHGYLQTLPVRKLLSQRITQAYRPNDTDIEIDRYFGSFDRHAPRPWAERFPALSECVSRFAGAHSTPSESPPKSKWFGPQPPASREGTPLRFSIAVSSSAHEAHSKFQASWPRLRSVLHAALNEAMTKAEMPIGVKFGTLSDFLTPFIERDARVGLLSRGIGMTSD